MKILITILLLFICAPLYATDNTKIKLFISNNTHEIDIQKAYARLTNAYHAKLENGTIDLLQKHHIEQGRFEDILGTYEMSSDKNVTGDNTEIFYSSPYERLSDLEIFTMATEFAKTFKQESVAVFIPSTQANSADIIVTFSKNNPSINAVINLIHEQLPVYANAFSLHLVNPHVDFNSATVKSIEWLGSKINIDDIKKVFPNDFISVYDGNAYLIFQNGQIEAL